MPIRVGKGLFLLDDILAKMRRNWTWIGLTLLVAAALIGAGTAQEPPSGDPVRGAQVYEAWHVVADVNPPVGDHPLWRTQTANQRSGGITWRCVSCHGWDYKGAEGAFGEGRPGYTGFPGVIQTVGLPEGELRAWLDGTRNPDHNFSAYLDAASTRNLIAFLRTRLINTDLLIDPKTGISLGSADRGGGLYAASCADCHGDEGADLNFGTANSPVFIGDLAVNDPWRFLHKTRFGQANTSMPAGENLGWSLQDFADVLAYSQSLPLGNPAAGLTDPGPIFNLEEQGSSVPLVLGAIVILVTVFGGVWVAGLEARAGDPERPSH